MKRKHILPASAAIFIVCGMMFILAAASGGERPPVEVAAADEYHGETTGLDFIGYPEFLNTPAPSEPPAAEEQTARLYSDADAEIIAKIVWAEARGVKTTAEKAAVIWCILNRYDAGYGESIAAVATAPNQFAYHEDAPVDDELMELALDVLGRWQAEQEGTADVGRTLPADYYYFDGDGVANHFRQLYNRDGSAWNWSLPSPYEEDGQ